MDHLPVIASVQDLEAAFELAQEDSTIRWYVERMARVYRTTVPWAEPEPTLASITASLEPAFADFYGARVSNDDMLELITDTITAAGATLEVDDAIVLTDTVESGLRTAHAEGWIDDSEFDEFLQVLTAARFVRTPEGVDWYKQPVGTPIVDKGIARIMPRPQMPAPKNGISSMQKRNSERIRKRLLERMTDDRLKALLVSGTPKGGFLDDIKAEERRRRSAVTAAGYGPRRVRTPEGALRYGQPIGSIIVPKVYKRIGDIGDKLLSEMKKGDVFAFEGVEGKKYKVEAVNMGLGGPTSVVYWPVDDPDTRKWTNMGHPGDGYKAPKVTTYQELDADSPEAKTVARLDTSKHPVDTAPRTVHPPADGTVARAKVEPDKGPTIRVRNEAQKILFEEHLMGQISDGTWENSRPFNHWQAWADADVVVDPGHIGRNFFAQKDNYQLNSSTLLDIIGDDMLKSVQAVDPSYDMKQMRKDLADLRSIFKTSRPNLVAAKKADAPTPPAPAPDAGVPDKPRTIPSVKAVADQMHAAGVKKATVGANSDAGGMRWIDTADGKYVANDDGTWMYIANGPTPRSDYLHIADDDLAVQHAVDTGTDHAARLEASKPTLTDAEVKDEVKAMIDASPLTEPKTAKELAASGADLKEIRAALRAENPGWGSKQVATVAARMAMNTPKTPKVSTQKSGRGPSGKVRNFDAMSDAKFNTEASKVEAENNDPEAMAEIAKSRVKRSGGQTAPAAPDAPAPTKYVSAISFGINHSHTPGKPMGATNRSKFGDHVSTESVDKLAAAINGPDVQLATGHTTFDQLLTDLLNPGKDGYINPYLKAKVTRARRAAKDPKFYKNRPAYSTSIQGPGDSVVSTQIRGKGMVRPVMPPKKSTTDSSGFTSAKAGPLNGGVVNYDARGTDAERFQPKMSLGDGETPQKGIRVVGKDGREGEIIETYQLASAVAFDDGTKKVVNNKSLNSRKGAPAAAPVARKSTPHITPPSTTPTDLGPGDVADDARRGPDGTEPDKAALTRELLDAKQALFRIKQDWHANPRSKTKTQYLADESKARARVQAAEAALAADAPPIGSADFVSNMLGTPKTTSRVLGRNLDANGNPAPPRVADRINNIAPHWVSGENAKLTQAQVDAADKAGMHPGPLRPGANGLVISPRSSVSGTLLMWLDPDTGVTYVQQNNHDIWKYGPDVHPAGHSMAGRTVIHNLGTAPWDDHKFDPRTLETPSTDAARAATTKAAPRPGNLPPVKIPGTPTKIKGKTTDPNSDSAMIARISGLSDTWLDAYVTKAKDGKLSPELAAAVLAEYAKRNPGKA